MLFQDRQDLFLEPGMALQPARIAPARMRQRQDFRPGIREEIFAPVLHRPRHVLPASPAQMIGLRLLADLPPQIDMRPDVEELLAPPRPAYAARGRNAARAVIPGKDKH